MGYMGNGRNREMGGSGLCSSFVTGLLCDLKLVPTYLQAPVFPSVWQEVGLRWSPKAFLVLRLCNYRSPGPGRCGGAGVSPWWRPVCRWLGSPGVPMMSSPMRMESAQTASHWASAEPLRQAMALRTEWRRSFSGCSCCFCKVPAQPELLALSRLWVWPLFCSKGCTRLNRGQAVAGSLCVVSARGD